MNPILIVNDYYNSKINEIDLNCENIIITHQKELNQNNENKREIKDLNELRNEIIAKIKSVEKEVFDNYTKNEEELLQLFKMEADQEAFKKKLFGDKFCYILREENIPNLFEYKLGLFLFSELSDYEMELLW